MRINDVLVEFAPAGGGGSGNYFQELASAWYNGTFDSGSLQKGIKSQQDVERLLQRGVVCPDGVTRKFGIDYNSDFDGVVISSDDYYEHADHDETDSRTGKPFGPYDYMEFGDEELDEDLTEFAPDSNDGGEDDALRNYARMWWAGDEATQMQIERALARMGWEIGEDEGGYDNGGVFVVRAGDENGNSYQSWAAEDLTEDGALDNYRSRIGTQGNIQRQNQRQQDWLDAHHQSSLDRMTNHRDAMNRLSNAGVDDTIARQEIRRERMRKDDDDWDKTFDVMRDRLNRYQWSSQKDNAEQGVAEGDLNEFARSGNGDDDDRGEDPYGRPEPKHYARSVDYFGRFEADHFDQEDMDDATGVFKGYWDYDGDMKQIAYFKFDDPARTGSDDPGMGWYYEPQNESVAEGIDDEEYGPELAALQKEFGKFTTHYDRMDQDPAYAAQWRKQNTDRLNQQGPDDEDRIGAAADDMAHDMGDDDNVREGNLNTKYSLKNMFGDVKSLDNLSLEQLNKAMDGRVNIVGRKFRGQEGNSFRYDVKLDNGNSYIMHIIYVHGLIDAWLTDEENNKIPLSKVKPQGVAEGKPREKEADYGADYQDMVSRVKKLAGLGPLKTVYDPQKRVYKNVPTAVQPKKEQR